MLGSAVVKVLSENANLVVFGTARAAPSRRFFNEIIAKQILSDVNIEHQDFLEKAFVFARPDVVINCVGLIKQLSDVTDPLQVIPINALLPHQLAQECKIRGARLIHISTDCVFDGSKGGYTEMDSFDAKDLYGISKYLGEVSYPHTITLRTSIIGHELQSKNSLVDWFLSQKVTLKAKSSDLVLSYYKFTQTGDELSKLINFPVNKVYKQLINNALEGEFDLAWHAIK